MYEMLITSNYILPNGGKRREWGVFIPAVSTRSIWLNTSGQGVWDEIKAEGERCGERAKWRASQVWWCWWCWRRCFGHGLPRDIWATANLLVKKPKKERGNELWSFMWLAIPAPANTLLQQEGQLAEANFRDNDQKSHRKNLSAELPLVVLEKVSHDLGGNYVSSVFVTLAGNVTKFGGLLQIRQKQTRQEKIGQKTLQFWINAYNMSDAYNMPQEQEWWQEMTRRTSIDKAQNNQNRRTASSQNKTEAAATAAKTASRRGRGRSRRRRRSTRKSEKNLRKNNRTANKINAQWLQMVSNLLGKAGLLQTSVQP